MDLRKIAWVMLLLGGLTMGITFVLYQHLKGNSPASANAALQENQPETSDQPAQGQEGDEADTPQPSQEQQSDEADPAGTTDTDAQPPVPDTDQDPDRQPQEKTPEQIQQEQAAKRQRAEAALWNHTRAQENKKRYIGSANPAGKFPFQLETVQRGGAVYTLKLARHQSTIADSDFASDHPEDYDKLWQEKEGLRGPYSLLNPLTHEGKTYLPFATRAIWWRSPSLPVRQDWKIANLDQHNWIALEPVRSEEEESQAYQMVITRDGRKILTLTKTYTVKAGEESFYLEIKIENHYRDSIEVCIDQRGPTGIPKEHYKDGEDLRQIVVGSFSDEDKVVQIQRKSISNAGEMTLGKIVGVGRSDSGDPALWLAAANKYFASTIYILPEQEQLNASTAQAKFYIGASMENNISRNFFTGVMIGRSESDKVAPVLSVAPGPDNAKAVRLNVFSGPKKRSVLNDEQENPLYARLNYMGLIDVSSGCFCAWEQLAFVMMWLLDALSVATLGNYGLAIILLVFVVRLILHPLSRKSQTSMARMQKLKPQIEKIQQKYKEDKATQQKEMMKLYRQAGASPFLGCLPMLLQIPIWIALWTSVNVSVELRHAGLLPIWLTDLSTPDRLVSWGTPLLGYLSSINLLPLLLGVAMYFQMKFSPQMAGGSAAATPEQEAQQKMFRYLMPGMMLVIFYNQPSGLTLYIMASTFVGVIESRVIRKHIEEKDAREAATEVVVQGPGKAARGARPKKPKGPFWHKQG